ncbi:MAG: hypothetical protein CBB68_04315 [Rhodospirillaceae bacterium TMED8]|nr:hypothetical protein [Magnetovibrio sp.]OUT51559.1 MAG: hypothetical protein CBB68_04315 [Rhodospirillaceae bacterium TMED8]
MNNLQQSGDDETQSIQLANQIINVANNRLEEGMPADLIAAGLRHAAANFSAFEFHRAGGSGDEQLASRVEDFIRGFEYYLERHAPGKSEPLGGLNDLISQAKEEL